MACSSLTRGPQAGTSESLGSPGPRQSWPRLAHPTNRRAADLALALVMLDTDRDGKLWTLDFDAAVRLAVGPGASDSNSACAERWQEITEPFMGPDGLVRVGPVVSALRHGDLFARLAAAASQERPSSTGMRPRAGSLGPFPSVCKYVSMFNKMDSDKNGVICPRDLKRALEGIRREPVCLDECQKIISRVDSNDDGVIDLTDFGPLVASLFKKCPMTTVCEDGEEEQD